MSNHAMPANRPAPDLGADNAAILSEAGLTDDEIAKLQR
jgi:crotonobetainyl-CoA:carnitine CoA-transferase CaiB-like acyl-CoA transferase